MIAWQEKQTDETRHVEQALRREFPNTAAYRFNSASIRVRIIDDRFQAKSMSEREDMVLPLVRTLPEDTQSDITVLLMLAPGEEHESLMNQEFEDPMQSML